MSRFVKVFALLAVPAILLASGDNAAAEQYFKLTGRHTDFGPRLFNFILLAGLLYYLLANPIKNFLKNRTNSIAKELEEIEAKRQSAKDSKIKAEEMLKEAKAKAIEIIEDAKKEAEVIKNNIKKHAEQEVIALEKIFNDKCEIERRKTLRETTVNVLDENISTDDIPLDANKIVQIVTKEVA
jgi:F-type H+-transporting ATPase subunit b